MRLRLMLISLLLSLSVYPIQAQNAAKNWIFGQGVRIDFNTSTPTATAITSINTSEGSSSISDSNGDLVFSTDGMKVWDKNNNQMPNGFGLKGDYSSTHSALIVPCSCSQYFIFTTSAAETNYSDGLRYSVVVLNPTINNGLGDVTTKNVLLLANASEKVAAVRDGNGGYWLAAHKMGTNQFFTYHINANSNCQINPDSAKISAVGSIYTGDAPTNFGQGQMKFSPDGNFIAYAGLRYSPGSSFVELFRFNKSTGVITSLGPTARDTSNDGFYGIEFSPDSNTLYATTIVANNFIYRYGNITFNSLTSRTPITNQGSIWYSVGALQLAPDGKIYVARKNKPSLFVLNNPNAANGGWTGIPFNLAAGSLSQLGLPSMVAGDFSCGPVPDVCCDKLRVSPYPNPPLNQDYRTFEVFNFKQPVSPICSIDINMLPAPPTTLWQGGMAFQNLNGIFTPVNFVFASIPPAYRRIPTLSPNMMSALSIPITSAAVKFNLGFDNTQPYNGKTVLTVNHCDGTKCVLEYKPWIVNPSTPSDVLPWSVNIRELSSELSEVTLTYQGGRIPLSPGVRGAKWLGLHLPIEGAEIYSIAGAEIGDERTRRFSLSSSSKTANAALFEFNGFLSRDSREQNGRTITLLIKKKDGLRIDPKQLRLTLYDENANLIMVGPPQP